MDVLRGGGGGGGGGKGGVVSLLSPLDLYCSVDILSGTVESDDLAKIRAQVSLAESAISVDASSVGTLLRILDAVNPPSSSSPSSSTSPDTSSSSTTITTINDVV